MCKRRKKIIVALLLTSVALILLKQALNVAVKVGLERGFAAGTDCIVTIEDATFNFFPLGASLKNGRIRHPSEPPDHGFRVREGSVRLINLFKLFTQKKVRLTDLFLNGVSAKSFGEETGFINTIDFLAGGDDHSAPPRTPKWHDFISRGWKVKLVNLVIHADEGDKPQLVIGSGVFTYKWKNILFGLTNTDPPEEPTILSGTAKTFSIQFKDEPPVLHGETKAVVDSLKGILWARQASLKLETPSGPSTVSVTGELHINNPQAYRLKGHMSIPPDHLQGILRPYSESLAATGPRAELSVEVSGALLDPIFEGEAMLELASPLAFVSRQACAIKHASSHFRISAAGLMLKETQVESLLEDVLLELSFSKDMPFRSDAKVVISPDNSFVARCLATDPSSDSPKWVQTTLEKFVTDSLTEIQASGTITPFTANATLASDILTSQKGVRSQLSSAVTLQGGVVEAVVKEQGSALRIHQAPATYTPESISTGFSLAAKSSLFLSLNYDLASGVLQIPKLELINYPLIQLIARAAPLMGDRAFQFASAAVQPESLIDGTLEMRRPKSGVISGRGSFALTTLKPFGVPVSAASIPIVFDRDRVRVSPIALETIAGPVLGEITASLAGDIDLSISAPMLDLKQVPVISDSLQLASALGQFQISFSKQSGKLRYLGDARISTKLSETSETLDTELKLTGDSVAASLNASVLGDHARFSLVYPVSETSAQHVTIDGSVEDFPLEVFFPEKEQALPGKDSSFDAVGTVTGRIQYKGLRSRPLLGSGSAVIDKFRINADGVAISHPRPLVMRVENGTLTFADVILLAGDREARLEGSVSDATGWHAALRGKWDLHSVAPRLPRVEQISGELEGNIAITGELLSPSLSGPLMIREGAISLPLGKTIIGANNVSVEAQLDKNSLIINRIFGSVGDGQVVGRGTISNVVSPRERDIAINLNLLGIELEPIENFTTRADGLITVSKDPQGPTKIAGEINISNAYYEDKINLRDILLALSRTITGVRSVESTGGQSSGGTSDLELDLALHADNSIILETNIAQAELRSDLRVQGPIKQPRIGGTIEVIEGSFGVQSRKFDIISGKLTFPDQRGNIDPTVDIIGETVLMGVSRDTYQVLIDIGGTLTRPTVSFSSDSGLAERDIVSLLFFGGQIEELSLLKLSTESSRISYGEILNPTSDLSLTERFTALASFSDVSIDTVSPLSSTELVPVVSATRPIIEGVDLVLRSELSSNQRSSASVSYGLTPYLSMIATWSNRSATNTRSGSATMGVGLRYRRSFPGLMIFPDEEAIQ